MANDSSQFRTREQLSEDGWTMEGNVHFKDQERYLPLYEAKLFHQYDHRFATFEGVTEKALRGGNAREMACDEKADPEAVVMPRYWVPEKEVAKRLDNREEMSGLSLPDPTRPDPTRPDPGPPRSPGSRLAIRRFSRATDQRTGICALIPGSGQGDSLITISVGSSPFGTSPAQQTSEPPSSLPFRESR